MLLPNPAGNYHFLTGIEPYSSGVVADAGHEIVHVTLRRPVPYRDGFGLIDRYLAEAGRPRAALCGVELRSSVPFTRQGFLDFNSAYRALLESWDLLVEGQNPVARTNVAPEWMAPAEPALYAFSVTLPAAPGTPRTFVAAGAGELRGGPLLEAPVVRPGETSPEALREKMEYVMRVMTRRLEGLGAGWEEVTAIDVYSRQPVQPLLGPVVLAPAGGAAVHGLRWYPSRPPIDELEYEMDVRGVRREEFLG